jgi:hypothetical protein
MMMRTFVQITSVDMFGHCGRDRHPTADMVGKRGEVVGMVALDHRTMPDVDGVLAMYTVRLDEPGEPSTFVDFMDFELTKLQRYLLRGVDNATGEFVYHASDAISYGEAQKAANEHFAPRDIAWTTGDILPERERNCKLYRLSATKEDESRWDPCYMTEVYAFDILDALRRGNARFSGFIIAGATEVQGYHDGFPEENMVKTR